MAIQLWEFPVQWSGSFTVVSTFKTEIISSESGKEQRRAMRAFPRRSFSFKLDALPAVIDELQYFMTTAQRNTVVMPEPVRWRRTTSGIPAGAAIVSVESRTNWMNVNQYVALLRPGRVQVFQIASVTDTTLGFTEAAAEPWPTDTRIVPAWKGLLAETLSFQFPTNRIMQGGIDFTVLPGEGIENPPEVSLSNVYYGRELFKFRVNWKDAPEISYSQSRQIVDYDRGVTAMFTPVAYNARAYTVDILNFTVAQAYNLTDFFARMKGRQSEFLFSPPGTPNMVLAAPYQDGSTNLLFVGRTPRLAFIADPALRLIEIKTKAGTIHRRRVVSAAAAGSNTNIGIDLAIPEIISEDTVKSISWMALARFESDELTIDWQTTEVSTAQVVVRTLEYVEPENTSGLDEGGQWLLDYYGSEFAEKYILDPLLIVLNIKEPRFALVVDE